MRKLLPLKRITLHGGAKTSINVEVADEPLERRQGLMCRKTVPDSTGMLFVFYYPAPLNFWMFNTYVPLDIIYLDEFGNAVGSASMSPCPRPAGYDDLEWREHCSSEAEEYGSVTDAFYALELPLGWVERLKKSDTEFRDGFFVSW